MEKIRIGIFGLGRGGSFYESITACGGVVAALCDKDEKKLNEAKEHCPEAECFTDFEKFIDCPMDAVLLANYFTQHAEYAIRFLEKIWAYQKYAPKSNVWDADSHGRCAPSE